MSDRRPTGSGAAAVTRALSNQSDRSISSGTFKPTDKNGSAKTPSNRDRGLSVVAIPHGQQPNAPPVAITKNRKNCPWKVVPRVVTLGKGHA